MCAAILFMQSYKWKAQERLKESRPSLFLSSWTVMFWTMLSLYTVSVGHFTKTPHKPSSGPCCLYKLYQWVTSQRHHTSHPLDHGVFISCITSCCLYKLYQWVTSQRHHTSHQLYQWVISQRLHTSHPLDHVVFISCISGSLHKDTTQAIL